MATLPQSDVVRFGAYEADLRTGELRKHGVRVKLQEQPFQLLSLLLERPGELVTREEIQRRLWSADTFVDFDHGLNTAMRRLRDALSDSADNPRWVETLPRRGYRFVGPVAPKLAPRNGDLPSAGSDAGDLPAVAAGEAADSRAAAKASPGAIAASSTSATVARWVLFSILSLTLAAAIAWRVSSRQQSIDSIAVLPFVNATNDPELDYISDGIAGSVTGNLAEIPTLRVMSRSSAFQYKGRKVDPAQAGVELGVAAVLVGSVQQEGDNLRISIELVDVRSWRQLWSQQYNIKRGELPGLQQQISRDTSERLRLRLDPSAQSRIATRHVPRAEAYELYLRGQHALGKRTPESLQEGLSFFQRAADADQDYAAPYEGMSAAYGLLAFYGGMSPLQALPLQTAALKRALELDPESSGSHIQRGYLAQANRDFALADREFRRAIEVEPNSAEAHYAYWMFLANIGRPDAALAEAYVAESLDPIGAGSGTATGWGLYIQRRYREAELRLRRLSPDFPPSGWVRGEIYEQTGRYQQAIETFQNSHQAGTRADVSQAFLAHTYILAGRKQEGIALLREMLALHQSSYFSPYHIAAIYVALHQPQEAVGWLRTAAAERDPWLTRLQYDPRFDPIRNLPDVARIQAEVLPPR